MHIGRGFWHACISLAKQRPQQLMHIQVSLMYFVTLQQHDSNASLNTQHELQDDLVEQTEFTQRPCFH